MKLLLNMIKSDLACYGLAFLYDSNIIRGGEIGLAAKNTIGGPSYDKLSSYLSA